MSIKLAEDQVSFRRHSYPQNAEINVTPFVDVMLVLLIIFMIASPLATVTVPVDLPRNTSSPAPPPATPVTVTVQVDGTLFVGPQKTDAAHLIPALLAATRQNLDTRILLRADHRLQYGQLMDVMNELSDGGFNKVGLVAEQSGKP
jgi:TonB system transport protein ExbD (group 1)